MYLLHILYKYMYCFVPGQRTKKWKYMFFVLNGTEQQLYYFENQKVGRLRTPIEL